MKKSGVQQLHIIPFDTGCVFYDCLSIDNSKNFIFAEKFVEKLYIECEKHKIQITKNIELKMLGKTITGIMYKDSSVAEQLICTAKLKDYLYCYILSNGIGIFVLADLNGRALVNSDSKIGTYSKALIANYQKKLTQATILNRYKGADVMPEEESLMLIFREVCWKAVTECSTKRNNFVVRKYSSTKTYKADGLSYILTIYLLNQKDFNTNEINHLMTSTIFNKVTDPENWDSINNTIKTVKSLNAPTVAKIGDINTYYSWSAVAVEVKSEIVNYEQAIADPIISTMLKAEMYVQSRWFIADNSMDNVNKNLNWGMESIQRIASLIEFSQAELENEISANMHSMYKQILNQIVITSEVKKLYKSVANQIITQKKIKEAYFEDKKRKNKFILDLFLACFSAASLYKTVLDLVKGNFGWWNYLIFGATLLIALGTIVFNYKNK